MNLTDEQILQVEEMAAALLPAGEIAILLGLPADERKSFEEIVKTHTNSIVFLAFHRGRLTTKYELRKTVIKLAKHGSPAAEPIAEKYIREQLI
jgi:hypothetical protein